MRQSDIDRFHSKHIPVTESGCFLWTDCVTTSGYGQFWMAGKNVSAHRTAMEIHAGPIPAGLFVCHKCDTPACVNPDHLYIGTPADNSADSVRKGRSRVPHGVKHSRAKLTEAQVLRVFADSRSQSAIARELGIAQSAVSFIKSGTNWSRVTADQRANLRAAETENQDG